ncbi:MAG: aromatic amino acid transport family protein [Simkaniaceae bacterium]
MKKTQNVPISHVISGTFLISGTAIGAGMLGIPLVTSQAGFFPAIFITAVVWIFMMLTGLLFLEATLWLPDGSNILSITRKFLGKKGQAFSGGMFIFLYYCLMVAYFAAGAPMLANAFEALTSVHLTGWNVYLLFGVVFGSIVAIGPKSIDRVNVIITFAMVLSWILLIGVAGPEVEQKRLMEFHFSPMFFAAPILFSAFGYHNVIPSLCSYLNRNVKVLRLSIICGTLLPFLIYFLWQWLIIGSLPPSEITAVLHKGKPVTEALESLTGKPWIALIGKFFAFFALVTSVLGVAFSMVDFLGDGMRMSRKGLSRFLLTILTFFPPFVLAAINPYIFDTALGVAGGFGEAYLNGLLPVLLVWIGVYRRNLTLRTNLKGGRLLLGTLFAVGLIVMGLEIWHLYQTS